MSDDDDVEVYVCHRVVDLPNPNPTSVKGKCEDCKEPIYLMPHAPQRMTKLCWQCAKKLAEAIVKEKEDETIVLMPGVLARYRTNEIN